MESLENQSELWRRWGDWKLGEWAELYTVRHTQWSGAHSPNFQSLHLRHSSFWFSKLSVTSPTSQIILQPFPRFTYVTNHSPTLPLLHLRHSSFSNPSFASPTSQVFTYVTWRAAHGTDAKNHRVMDYSILCVSTINKFAILSGLMKEIWQTYSKNDSSTVSQWYTVMA